MPPPRASVGAHNTPSFNQQFSGKRDIARPIGRNYNELGSGELREVAESADMLLQYDINSYAQSISGTNPNAVQYEHERYKSSSQTGKKQ